jgi:hypothetical protein
MPAWQSNLSGRANFQPSTKASFERDVAQTGFPAGDHFSIPSGAVESGGYLWAGDEIVCLATSYEITT